MGQLQFGRDATLRLEFDALEMERGPSAHRLSLRYAVTPRGCPDGSTLLIKGQLRLAGPAHGWLGALGPDVDLPVHVEAEPPRTVLLTTTLSNSQITTIEQVREGADLQFQVDLRATLVTAGSDLTYPMGYAQDPVQVRAHDWAQHLERLGALVSVPLVVPLPLNDPNGLLAQAGGRLQEALRALANGRPEEAVRLTRLAMDPYKELAPPAKYDAKGDPQLRDLEQRFAALRTALFSLSSGAAHDDATTKAFVYTHADATAIIATLAALLQR